MKHIKCEAIMTPWGYHVVRIVEQTHRGNKLGDDGKCYFGQLYSSLYPAGPDKDMDGYSMRGAKGQYDLSPFLIPDERMPEFREEIRKYNEHFADKPEPNEKESGVEVIE